MANQVYGSKSSKHKGGRATPLDVDASSLDSIYKRSSSQAIYHQSLLGTHNTIGQSEALYSTNPLVKRPRFQSSLPVYPQRPGEKDCAHYMLTRTCKFGDSCRFDHPLWVPEGGCPGWKEIAVAVTSEDLPERPEAPDCSYFLKTQACKFGPKCKFNHPKDKIVSSSALENTDGSELPERPSEPQCGFYMKTGVCKFGSSCRFDHPKNISITIAEGEDGNGGQMAANGKLAPSIPTFTPATLHNSKGLSIRPGEEDCSFYMKTGSCKFGATCRYNHPEIYAVDPPVSFVSTIGMVNPASSVLQLGLGPTIYPQRPGQMECTYYMKAGKCMYGDTCKFHHPVDRASHANEAQQQDVNLTLAGLPRREGAVKCPYYMKTGACKYGVTCKFDHPPPGEVMGMAATSEEVKDGRKENDTR
ncbi:putative transcription factor C3H family [Helianthus anomalus]